MMILSTATAAFTVTSLFMGKPIADIVGQDGCKVFWGLQSVSTATFLLGGLSMALFRYRCIMKQTSNHSEAKKLAQTLILAQLVITPAWVAVHHETTLKFSNGPAMMEFCEGVTANVFIITKPESNEGRIWLYLYSALMLSLALASLAIYARAFDEVRKHDLNMRQNGVVGPETTRDRMKRNAVSMLGQFVNFSVTLSLNVAILVVLNQKLVDVTLFQVYMFPCHLVVANCIFSVSLLLTSPELRRAIVFPE